MRLGSLAIDLRLNDFFRHHDHALGGANSFDHHAEIAPAVGIAFAIGTLHVNDGDVGIERTNRPQGFPRLERRKYLIEEMIALGDIAAQCRSSRKKRHPHGTGLQRQGDGEVGHVENLHSILLNRAAKVVGRAHHHIANPRGDNLLDASRSDDLVEKNVRDRSDQRQTALFLSDDLVPRGERDHLLHLQAESDRRAVGNKFADRVVHGEQLRH